MNFVKEVGQLLEELSPQGMHGIFERFRGILHEGDIDKRVQYTIEGANVHSFDLFFILLYIYCNFEVIPFHSSSYGFVFKCY